MSSPSRGPLGLFEATGVEIEYMIVGRDDLAVLPIADQVLAAAAGEVTAEVVHGELAWSNELVLHVIELKAGEPAPNLDALVEPFERGVRRVHEILAPLGGRLMPTAMHPLMDPLRETRLWPHEHGAIYEAFDRAFGCRGHGWANLQSVHVNLPFADDEEFARLHAAVRLLLPLLPALAASSPLVEGRFTRSLDNRLEFYRTHTEKLPSVAGVLIPEAVFSREAYERRILRPMYRDIAPFDPGGVLQEEFLNARGAIARFGRGSIEIRLLDTQECPRADLAVVVLVVGVLRMLVDEDFSSFEHQQGFDEKELAALLRRTTADADRTHIHDREYLRAFGVTNHATLQAGELWKHLVDELFALAGAPDEGWRDLLEEMLSLGPLARRIRSSLAAEPAREDILEVYGRLCDCLRNGELYHE